MLLLGALAAPWATLPKIFQAIPSCVADDARAVVLVDQLGEAAYAAYARADCNARANQDHRRR
eukprot:10792634-Alexandrium_andersonii.AAC.1